MGLRRETLLSLLGRMEGNGLQLDKTVCYLTVKRKGSILYNEIDIVSAIEEEDEGILLGIVNLEVPWKYKASELKRFLQNAYSQGDESDKEIRIGFFSKDENLFSSITSLHQSEEDNLVFEIDFKDDEFGKKVKHWTHS